MSPASPLRRRWRRTALATAGASLMAAMSLVSATPAAAVNAPLITTDGVGIRIDENAILGPALELIEDELQPYVNQKIYEGALANSVMDDPDWVQGSANVELSLDFVNAGTSGYPQGGINVQADLNNIMMRFYRYGEWWQPECQYRVNPDPGWIKANAKINTALLPNAPLAIDPIQAYWDNDPTITREIGPWTCGGYLLDEWWEGLWGSGTDVAAQLEAELDDVAQDTINDLWTQHVTPVINSLNEFGITFGQVRTDNNGLIVTANVNATNGLTLPGVGGTFNVSNTPDSGATSNVNTLLAARSEVTVSIHPNVVAQFLNALNQRLTGEWGTYFLAPSIEPIIVPTTGANYDDDGWTMRLQVLAPPAVTPTGTGGRPLVGMSLGFAIYNTASGPFSPVAEYTASMSGAQLVTEVRASNWGPNIKATTATLSSVVETSNNGDAATLSAAQLQPYVRTVWNSAATDLFTGFVSLPPLNIGGLAVSLCSSCTRFSGDQRYTEFFNIA